MGYLIALMAEKICVMRLGLTWFSKNPILPLKQIATPGWSASLSPTPRRSWTTGIRGAHALASASRIQANVIGHWWTGGSVTTPTQSPTHQIITSFRAIAQYRGCWQLRFSRIKPLWLVAPIRSFCSHTFSSVFSTWMASVSQSFTLSVPLVPSTRLKSGEYRISLDES